MNVLEKRGLIRRVRNEQDRRLINVFRTQEGWALRDEVLHFAAEVNGIATAPLSSWEAEALRSLLVRVTGALEAEEQARAGWG
jgi:DNA-binding MarR family transcriptional regulator